MNLVKFTEEQDILWQYYFCFWVNDGKPDLEADRLAWIDICSDYPELRKYDGAIV